MLLVALGWSLTTTAEASPAKPFIDPENEVFQYCLAENPADESNTGQYFLWIPPECKRINGLFLAPINMCEMTFMRFPETRALCRELGLGIVLFQPSVKSPMVVDAFPDLYPPKNGPGRKIFNYKAGAVEFLQGLLDRMAATTGYPELAQAPLIVLSHSWAGSFAIQAAYGMPNRVICAIPLKVGGLESGGGMCKFDPETTPANRLNGVPVLSVEEQGGPNLDKTAGWDCWGFRQAVMRAGRKRDGNPHGNPISRIIQYGFAHCEMSAPLMHHMVSYVREACRKRLPKNPDSTGGKCVPIDINDGWLIDDRLDRPATGCAPAAPYASFTGNRDTAPWYFSEKLARECEAYFRQAYERKIPQCIAFLDPATGKPFTGSRLSIPRLADDHTFTVTAVNVPSTDNTWYTGTTNLGTSPSPMIYSVVMGSIVQVGPDRFKVAPSLFGNGGCGPTVEADNFGDANVQPASTSIFLTIEPVKDGRAQKITFPAIGNVAASAGTIELKATSDAGLPVSYVVSYGPAVVDGTRLRITQVPAKAVFPISIKIGACQMGRYGQNPVRRADMVYQTFNITR